MTGGQEDTTVGLVLPDNVGSSGGGQDSILSNNELGYTVCRSDLQDRLYGFWGEVASISTDHQSCAFGLDSVEDRLDEVLGVVLD